MKQGQEIYTSVRSLTYRYLVAFSTSLVNSERLLKRLSLHTSEIRTSQPKIKKLIELFALLDGTPGWGKDPGLSISVWASVPGRKQVTYSITRGSGALRTTCKETGRSHSGSASHPPGGWLAGLPNPLISCQNTAGLKLSFFNFKLLVSHQKLSFLLFLELLYGHSWALKDATGINPFSYGQQLWKNFSRSALKIEDILWRDLNHYLSNHYCTTAIFNRCATKNF